jgi:hypothetical protein
MPSFDPVTLRKRCPHCRRELRLVAFNRSRSMPDGYAGWCRRCTRAAQTRWWLANLERYAEWNRRRRAAYVHKLASDREKICARCARPFIAPAGVKRWTCDPCQRTRARLESKRSRRRHADERRRARSVRPTPLGGVSGAGGRSTVGLPGAFIEQRRKTA